MPATLTEEDFEDHYTDKFKSLFRRHGLFITYERDRAATDVGVQLRVAPGELKLSNVRVWFQLKGKHSKTFTKAQFDAGEPVPVKVSLDHLKFWYAGGEATYLIVYLESADLFLAEDVRDIVDAKWGPAILDDTKKTITVDIQTSSVLTQDRIKSMLAHRSMRIDGPAFRGRPLGHRLDPLRSELEVFEPNDFEVVVGDLLRAFGYTPTEMMDPSLLLQDTSSKQRATLTTGTLFSTWEWIFQLGTEFGVSEDSMLREEGQVFRAFGRTAVLVHSLVDDDLKIATTASDTISELKSRGIKQLLVFCNAPDQDVIGPYRPLANFCAMPEGLGNLTYNLLTTTLVYLDHRSKLRWRYVNYQIDPTQYGPLES